MNPLFPDLNQFFLPKRIAFIGATEDLSKFGGRCMRLLIDFGFSGEIYPVNPKRDSIFGHRCYPSLADLPQRPDHVGIVLPSMGVIGAIEECVSIGVPFATLFSAGFSEMGTEEGRLLQGRAVSIARSGGLRFMGPNCNGMINFVDGVALTSTAAIKGQRRPAGDLGIVSQSGGAGQISVMWRAQQAGLGISYQVSCGNDADLDLLDYIAYMLESEATQVVMVVAERIPDSKKLRALANRSMELDKPILMVKAGRTLAGSRMAASHTGSLTGSESVCDAALRQMGIVRVEDTNELYDAAMLLRRKKHLYGNRAASTSISGGNLVLAADLGALMGIDFPPYSDNTQKELKAFLPGFSGADNPTDLTSAAIGRQDSLQEVVKIISQDPSIDIVIPIITLSQASEIRGVAAISAESSKPFAILWTGCAIDDPTLTHDKLVAQGHAVYRDSLQCMKAVRVAMRYSQRRQLIMARPQPKRPADIHVQDARKFLRGCLGTLSESESKKLLKIYGIPITNEILAKNSNEALVAAKKIGYPVALKIQSPAILHKSDAGAIKLGVIDEQGVKDGYQAVISAAINWKADAHIEGILVQEMVEDGFEVLIGVSVDPTFGPVITVGLGGIYVEIIRDLTFRIPPLGLLESHEMLNELRAYPILSGARGEAPADIEFLARCIERVSWLAVDLQDCMIELDINPIRVFSGQLGGKVVDALVVLK